jgi:hypothetical protein
LGFKKCLRLGERKISRTAAGRGRLRDVVKMLNCYLCKGLVRDVLKAPVKIGYFDKLSIDLASSYASRIRDL